MSVGVLTKKTGFVGCDTGAFARDLLRHDLVVAKRLTIDPVEPMKKISNDIHVGFPTPLAVGDNVDARLLL
jgi:hypothetical protein